MKFLRKNFGKPKFCPKKQRQPTEAIASEETTIRQADYVIEVDDYELKPHGTIAEWKAKAIAFMKHVDVQEVVIFYETRDPEFNTVSKNFLCKMPL